MNIVIKVVLSVGEEGSLGNCMANSRLLAGFLSLVGVRDVNRTGIYKLQLSSKNINKSFTPDSSCIRVDRQILPPNSVNLLL